MTADELYQLGLALDASGKKLEAITAFDSAIALQGSFGDAYCARANVLFELGRFEEALADYDRTIILHPALGALYFNRANTLSKLRRFDEAIRDYESAIRIEPRSENFHLMLGHALEALGRNGEAAYIQAIKIQPDYAEAYYSLGCCLARRNRMSEALDNFRRALAIRPRYTEALVDYANVLVELGRLDDALVLFDKAAAANPNYPNLKGIRLSTRMSLCHWADFENACAELFADISKGQFFGPPFPILALPSNPLHQLICAREHVDAYFPPPSKPPSRNRRSQHRKIRLAYFSGAFRHHPTTFLMTDIFGLHDRDKFEVIGFSYWPHDGSPARVNVESKFDRFLDVSTHDDSDVARLVRELAIDIAVDLDGFVQGSRPGVLVQNDAPLKVSYLGYPGTLGASFIDYLIADRTVIPASDETYFAENIVTLPGCYQANSRRLSATRTGGREQYDLPETGFVFCCFNSGYKITPDVFAVWMRLLRTIRGSVLWLMDTNQSARGNLRREAEKYGVAAARLIFAADAEHGEHLGRHRLADLFLDTFYYNAHTGGSDALWAGLPVLTCEGRTFASRVGASLLSALDLEELIAHSPAEYEAMALALASDPARLAGIKARLQKSCQTSSLFDPHRFTRNLDRAFEAMWQRYQRGEKPAGFAVDVS